LNGISDIEAFSPNFIEQLRKDKILAYFKSCGLELDENEEYEKNEEAQKLIPSPDLVKKAVSLKRKYEEELAVSTGTFPEDKEKIKSLNLLCDVNFSPAFISAGKKCLQPNLVKNDAGKTENVNLVFYPSLKYSEYNDVVLVHEFLHCLEGSVRTEGNRHIFSTGFESVELQTSENSDINDSVEHERRQYEVFSENIHQRLAIMVTEELHSRGVRFFESDKECKTRGATEFEKLDPITEEFFNKFGKSIMYARMTGNISKLQDKVGRDNFDKLNELVISGSRKGNIKSLAEQSHEVVVEMIQNRGEQERA